MRLNNKICKFLFQPKSSAGFTLMELLIGAAIATVIIGVAGYGLLQIMRASQKGNIQTKRRAEIARAYDFISDEIRRARLVEDDTNISNDAKNFTSTDKEVVLVLKIPVPDIDVNKDGTVDANDNRDRDRDDVDNNEANVIYYVSNPATSAWKGPKVLYRWGPPMGSDGEYTAGNWGYEALIDELDDNPINLNDGTDPDCEAGWTASDNAPGFAACIDGNNKTAQLFINGYIATSGGLLDETYKSADTKTVTRSNDVDLSGPYSDNDRTYHLGGEFSCDASTSRSWPVETELTFYESDDSTEESTETLSEGGSSDFEIDEDQRVTITSTPDPSLTNCNPLTSSSAVSIDIKIDSSGSVAIFNGDSDDYKVKIFRNGDIISTELIQNAYEGQKTFIKFLKDKGINISWTDTDNDTQGGVNGEYTGVDGEVDVDDQYSIVLNDNQALIAFEIGQDDEYLDDADTIPNPGFDFQDNLVLINSDVLK
jgi:type II secretory pathway pseudopilin PulG